MASGIKQFAQRWVIITLGVLVAANVVRGIQYESMAGLLVASLLLGILNAFLRPILLLLTLPLLIVTLGLFTLVINALLLMFVGWLVGPFSVAGFWAAFLGGLVISIISLIVNALLGTGNPRIQVRNSRSRRPPPGGKGPVIDV